MTRGRVIAIAAALAALIAFGWWQNNGLVTSRYEVSCPRLPAAFEGFTIAQVSDLHNKRFGQGQRRLLRALAKAQPDIIVITGDIVDSRRYDLGPAVELVRGAAEIAPVYYVSGNHERRQGRYEATIAALAEAGAALLEDRAETIARNGESIGIAGLAEPEGQGAHSDRGRAAASAAAGEGFTLLLAHRPERIGEYAGLGVDLVFTGHAHGGQFRLPGLGGLIAPDQGFFPEYSQGLHTTGDTAMIVSRGLGNSLFPLRLFNRPELVLAELHR